MRQKFGERNDWGTGITNVANVKVAGNGHRKVVKVVINEPIS